MEQIEVRTWDPKTQEMLPSLFLGDIISGMTKAGSILGEIPDSLSNRVIYMLYTGLRDKEEVKIFRGDIVEWDTSYDSCPTGSEVVFYRGMFGVHIGDAFKPLSSINRVCKIIGNTLEREERR